MNARTHCTNFNYLVQSGENAVSWDAWRRFSITNAFIMAKNPITMSNLW